MIVWRAGDNGTLDWLRTAEVAASTAMRTARNILRGSFSSWMRGSLSTPVMHAGVHPLSRLSWRHVQVLYTVEQDTDQTSLSARGTWTVMSLEGAILMASVLLQGEKIRLANGTCTWDSICRLLNSMLQPSIACVLSLGVRGFPQSYSSQQAPDIQSPIVLSLGRLYT